MSKRILALIEDLFFAVQVRDTASKLGFRTTVVQQEQEFTEQLASSPDLVLVDTTVGDADWTKLVRAAKAGRRPVVAFGDHRDLEARERALTAGADTFVANAVVATDLAGLLRRHAGKEAL